MFKHLSLRSVGLGTVAWHGRTVAVLRGWTVRRGERAGEWRLSANVDRADRFLLTQRPLSFHAPRKGGFWCWPVVAVTLGRESLTARLGPPEQ